jgi:hypothetical protein
MKTAPLIERRVIFMTVFVVIHRVWEECVGERDKIYGIYINALLAIEGIKNIDIWETCETLGLKEYDADELVDKTYNDGYARKLYTDDHGSDTFYIEAYEVKVV